MAQKYIKIKELEIPINIKNYPNSKSVKVYFKGKDKKSGTVRAVDDISFDIFAGEMMRMGKEFEIPVPYCEYTYHMIKALEEKNDGKFNY